jgi:hypothetical protein
VMRASIERAIIECMWLGFMLFLFFLLWAV